MPVYTSSYFDNAPMGLEFEAGIGFNTTRVENNGLTYYAQYQSNQIFEQNLLTNQTLYDFSQKFKSFNIMLGLKTRYALSENLLVNLGIRFTASSRLKNSNIAINEYTNDFQDKLLTNAIDMRLHRIVVLGVGLSYVF
jgi:opacity protein-like surface antigen